MFYATFKGTGIADILEFETEEQRNDWVNFNDPFSALLKKIKTTQHFNERK